MLFKLCSYILEEPVRSIKMNEPRLIATRIHQDPPVEELPKTPPSFPWIPTIVLLLLGIVRDFMNQKQEMKKNCKKKTNY